MNAIDVSTGSLVDLTGAEAEITTAAREFSVEADFEVDEDTLKAYTDEKKGHLGPGSSVKPKDLATSGWGVVFTKDESADVIEALRPLREWRKSQAGALYKEYLGATGYAGQSKQEFLGDADGFGVVEPAQNGVPYYLLLVGDPQKISFKFQYLLDVQYAVGRIHFDTPAEYRLYAENVVAAEKGKLTLPQTAAFYGTANKNDTSTTEGSNKKLIEPMKAFTEKLLTTTDPGVEPPANWEILPEPPVVTKAAMVDLLTKAPALVMMAAHGAKFPVTNPDDQKQFNGALLSEDFEFAPPGEKKPIPLNAFLTARDVPPNARLHGSIFFIFACYGGGTPQFEDFVKAGATRQAIANEAFLAALPKRLLTGGALAVVAHIERAWTTSFEGARAKTNQLQTFTSMWQPLMEGFPVGFAMESFNSKYAELATQLASEIFSDGILPNKAPDNPRLRSVWEAMHDARNFCVIGDPAVRIHVSKTPSGPVPIPREPVSISAGPPPAPPQQPPSAVAMETPERPVASLDAEAMAPTLQSNLEAVVQELTTTLQSLVTGLSHIEVSTESTLAGGKTSAVTRIGIDGKTVNIVPAANGKIDEALWAIHLASVDKAIANRAEMIKLATATAASLLAVVRK